VGGREREGKGNSVFIHETIDIGGGGGYMHVTGGGGGYMHNTLRSLLVDFSIAVT
jgi:hypothetical protein